MLDLDWEVVTKGRVYRRLRDKLALSSLLERLEKDMEELLGFTVFCGDVPLISWDVENKKIWWLTEEGHKAAPCPGHGKPFCYLRRYMTTTGEDVGVWEFGVEPWAVFNLDGEEFKIVKLLTEVSDEQ